MDNDDDTIEQCAVEQLRKLESLGMMSVTTASSFRRDHRERSCGSAKKAFGEEVHQGKALCSKIDRLLRVREVSASMGSEMNVDLGTVSQILDHVDTDVLLSFSPSAITTDSGGDRYEATPKFT